MMFFKSLDLNDEFEDFDSTELEEYIKIVPKLSDSDNIVCYEETAFVSLFLSLYKNVICKGSQEHLLYGIKIGAFNISQKCSCGMEMFFSESNNCVVCSHCSSKKSITFNTIWYGSHLTKEQIFILPYHFFYHHSLQETGKEVDLSTVSVSHWNNKMRLMCLSYIIENEEMIGGENYVVEIDECIRMKRKRDIGIFCFRLLNIKFVGRIKHQDWIFGGIERPYKVIKKETPVENESILSSVYMYDMTCRIKPKCFMERVANRSEEVLINIIRRKVRPGTIIVSDCWKAYTNLEQYGYIHYTVNHSKNFVNPLTGACTNTIEGSWHLFRSSLPSRGVKMSVIYLYMAQFLYMMMIEKKLQNFLRDLYNFEYLNFRKVQEVFEEVKSSEMENLEESNKIREEIFKEKKEEKKLKMKEPEKEEDLIESLPYLQNKIKDKKLNELLLIEKNHQNDEKEKELEYETVEVKLFQDIEMRTEEDDEETDDTSSEKDEASDYAESGEEDIDNRYYEKKKSKMKIKKRALINKKRKLMEGKNNAEISTKKLISWKNNQKERQLKKLESEKESLKKQQKKTDGIKRKLKDNLEISDTSADEMINIHKSSNRGRNIKKKIFFDNSN
jgi:hypothetical protein